MFQLFVVSGSRAVPCAILSGNPIEIGRSPNAQVVLDDPSVSWMHATAWAIGERVFLRDIGSSNGTYIDGEVVRGTRDVRPQAEIRIGHGIRMVVRAAVGLVPSPMQFVRDVLSGLIAVVRDGKFTLSTARGQVPGEVEAHGVLRVHDPRGTALGSVERGVAVDGTIYVVDEQAPGLAPTRSGGRGPFPYRVEATHVGGRAIVAIRHRKDVVMLGQGKRAQLVRILGARVAADRVAGVPISDVGWCSRAELIAGLWGASGTPNDLYMLTSRLRALLEQHGLDPNVLEREPARLRLRVIDVRIPPAS